MSRKGAIIGAGIAGLSAAAYAAKGGNEGHVMPLAIGTEDPSGIPDRGKLKHLIDAILKKK